MRRKPSPIIRTSETWLLWLGLLRWQELIPALPTYKVYFTFRSFGLYPRRSRQPVHSS